MVAKFVKTEVCGPKYSEGSKEKGQKTLFFILFFIVYLFMVQKCKSEIVCLANSWKASHDEQGKYMNNTSHLIKTTKT